MNLANGLILMCAIVSLGAIALIGFAVWIGSNDDTDSTEHHQTQLS